MGHIKPFFLAMIAILVATASYAQSNYRIQSGDTLTIEVLEDPELNRSVIVLSDGRISFPLAGTLRVAGRTIAEVQASVTSAISSNFATSPNVFVAVLPAPELPVEPVEPEPDPTMEVFFLGEVNTPGSIMVTPGQRFLQVMAGSGGLTRFAADKRIQLRRTDPATGQTRLFEINYRAILDGAQIQNNIVIEDGDVIIVPERRLFE